MLSFCMRLHPDSRHLSLTMSTTSLILNRMSCSFFSFLLKSSIPTSISFIHLHACSLLTLNTFFWFTFICCSILSPLISQSFFNSLTCVVVFSHSPVASQPQSFLFDSLACIASLLSFSWCPILNLCSPTDTFST